MTQELCVDRHKKFSFVVPKLHFQAIKCLSFNSESGERWWSALVASPVVLYSIPSLKTVLRDTEVWLKVEIACTRDP